jgi:hypothetical protein
VTGGTEPEPGAIDLAREATLAYSTENPAHPLEHLLDRWSGPGGARWQAARPDETAVLVIEFDRPRPIGRLVYEAEETACERTQEVHVAASADAGRTYQPVLVQEYIFSPHGATFQREDLRLALHGVDRLRLTIIPNKRVAGTATLTTLQVFG